MKSYLGNKCMNKDCDNESLIVCLGGTDSGTILLGIGVGQSSGCVLGRQDAFLRA